jgi:uncharacterized protein YecE (DUF72 family)
MPVTSFRTKILPLSIAFHRIQERTFQEAVKAEDMKSFSNICRVGCCGFGMGKAAYYEKFDLVEIQQTFYQPPLLSTLKKWRLEAPAGFEFALKAWQLITHSAQSPTFRRLKVDLSDKQKSEAGSFGMTPLVMHAYQTSVECALALEARRLIFQCPASFKPSSENVERMRRFFSAVERPSSLSFLWEPRGAWPEPLIAELCKELNIEHVVDPFVNQIITPGGRYYRLHGIGGWRHVYTDEQLESMVNLTLKDAARKDFVDPVYMLFNNGAMTKDALRFEMMLKARLVGR